MTLRLRIFIFNLMAVTMAFFLVILIGYRVLQSTVIESTYEKLNLIRDQKILTIEKYFEGLIAASDIIGSHIGAIDALENYPHNRESRLHQIVKYTESLNILDLALVRLDGHIVFAAANRFKTGQLLDPQDANFAEIRNWAREASRGNFLFLDFNSKTAAARDPVSYLAVPVFQDQKAVGFIMFCISLRQIDQITTDQFSWSDHGLGSTGETLIYGEDGGLRSTSRFSPAANNSLKGDESFAQLGEVDEIQERGLDYRGAHVFRSIGKINLPDGRQWYIEVKMDCNEAFSLFRRLLIASGTAAALITLIFFLLSYVATHQITQPIQMLIRNLENYGTDNFIQKISYASRDEIGALVKRYNRLVDRLDNTTVSRDFVDSVIQSLQEYLLIVQVSKNTDEDKAYRILQANNSALAALQISEQDLKGDDFKKFVVAGTNLEDPQWLMKNRQTLKGELRTSEGKMIPVSINWSLLPDRGDHWIFVFACTDITETQAHEKALIQTRESALKASFAKSDFLARMSHEIRTPLNAIIGMTEALEDSGLTEEQRTMINVCANAGENLLGLINDILDLSKIEAQEVVIEHIPFNIVKAVRSVCEIFHLKAKSKGIELIADIRVPINTVAIGDPMRTRQILINLIGNALKFTEKGRIEVSLEYIPHQKIFTFRVKDTGLGIPDSKKNLIFRRFSQTDSSITRRFGGSGLGLAICKNLVELMSGQIGFESAAGVGSQFYFSVPFPASGIEVLSESAQIPFVTSELGPPVSLTPCPLKKHLKVLVVDDTEDNRFLIKAYLRKHDCEILEAADGEQALEVVRMNEPDLVFMDVQMPVLDGYSATQKIRSFEKEVHRKPTLIVALSANAQSENIELSTAAGCNDYLTKPIKKNTLYSLMEKYFA